MKPETHLYKVIISHFHRLCQQYPRRICPKSPPKRRQSPFFDISLTRREREHRSLPLSLVRHIFLAGGSELAMWAACHSTDRMANSLPLRRFDMYDAMELTERFFALAASKIWLLPIELPE